MSFDYDGPDSSGGGTWGSITGTLSDQTDLQSALDSLVPYTGATGSVDLGAHNLTATKLIFGGSFDLQKNADSNGFGIGSGYGGLTATLGANTIGIGIDVLNGATVNYRRGVFIGSQAGRSAIGASDSVAIGYEALKNAASGASVTAVGYQAGLSGGGQNSTMFGFVAGNGRAGIGNSYFGAITGVSVTGNGNTAVGYNCLSGATSNEGVAIGFASLTNTTGTLNQAVALGYYAFVEAGNINTSLAIGSSAGRAIANIENSILLGANAGQYSTALDECLYLGNFAGAFSESFGTVAIGVSAFTNSKADNVTAIGQFAGNGSQGDSAIYIGPEAGRYAIKATRSTFISPQSGYSASSAYESAFIGYQSGYESTYGNNSSFIGGRAGYSATNAAHSIFIGDNSGYADTVVNKTVGVISSVLTTSFYWAGDGLNVGDIGTVSTGDANATVEIIEIKDGQLKTLFIVNGGTKFGIGDYIYMADGTSGELSVDTIDGPYKPISAVSIGSNAGTGYFVGDTIYVDGSESGMGTADLSVDSVDGLVGEINTSSIDQAGLDYVVSDTVYLSGGNNDSVITIDTVDGGGEVTSFTVTSGGSGYTDGVYEAINQSGSFAGSGFYVSITVYLGAVTSVSILSAGLGYDVGSDVTTTTSGSGTGLLINVDTIDPTLGTITGVSISNAGTMYNVTPGAAWTTSAYGESLEIDIDEIELGAAKTIALVSGGTGYQIGGYLGENVVTGIGVTPLQIIIDEISSPVVTGTSIAIGRYSGTGGYSGSIAIGHGVINSAALQMNFGNVLYGTGIYGDDIQDATPFAGGKIGVMTNAPTATLDVEGDVKLGVGGNIFLNCVSETATLDFPSIASNSYEDLTMTITGATVGASVFLGAPDTLEANLTFCGWVTAADTVTIRVHNGSGGAIDPASNTWRATVFNY